MQTEAYIRRCFCGTPMPQGLNNRTCCRRGAAIDNRLKYAFVRHGAVINTDADEDRILEQAAEWFSAHSVEEGFPVYSAWKVEEIKYDPNGGRDGRGKHEHTGRVHIFHGPAQPSREFSNRARVSQVRA